MHNRDDDAEHEDQNDSFTPTVPHHLRNGKKEKKRKEKKRKEKKEIVIKVNSFEMTR